MVLAVICALTTPATMNQHTIYSMAWHPGGKSLYYVMQEGVGEWPSRQLIRYPKTSHDPNYPPDQISFNKSGSKALISRVQTDVVYILDTRTKKMSAVLGDVQTAWWWGNEVARIRNDRRTGDQFVQVGTRKRALDIWHIAAADPDGQVFLAEKPVKQGGGEIALYTIDRKTLKARTIRRDPGDFYVEYDARDSVAWNPRTRTAAIGITSDTGATSASLLLWKPGKRAEPVDIGMASFLRQPPRWEKDRILVSMFGSTGGASKVAEHLDVVALFDPRTGRHETLHKRVVTSRLDEKKHEWVSTPPTFPYISVADLSPNRRRLAMVKGYEFKSEVVVKDVP